MLCPIGHTHANWLQQVTAVGEEMSLSLMKFHTPATELLLL